MIFFDLKSAYASVSASIHFCVCLKPRYTYKEKVSIRLLLLAQVAYLSVLFIFWEKKLVIEVLCYWFGWFLSQKPVNFLKNVHSFPLLNVVISSSRDFPVCLSITAIAHRTLLKVILVFFCWLSCCFLWMECNR